MIDLHHAFAKGEDGIAFIIQIPYDETQKVSIRHMPSEIISADWLPLPGEFLNLDTKAVAQLYENLTIKELQAI